MIRRALGMADVQTVARFNMALLMNEVSLDESVAGWDCDLQTRALAKAADSLSQYQVTVLLAEIDGQAVGMAVILPGSTFGSRANCVTIQGMWVEPHARGGVVARKLWNEVKRLVDGATIQVQVSARNATVRDLYRSIGFEERWVSMERLP